MLTNLLCWLGFKKKKSALTQPSTTKVLYHRSQHSLSRRDISKQALKVLYRLHDAGYQAYLVGGGVRDVLLGLHPKDFDVVTDAHPEEIYELFRNSRMIGRRFRLVHVHFGGNIIEVATFRAEHPDSAAQIKDESLALARDDGMIVRDNIYGTFEQDVWRRDFTVNALYYNIADFSLIDFVGGMEDLKTKTLRMIGDPRSRYREDPVRMLRALRFAAKLNFTLHEATAEPLAELAKLLHNVPGARVFDEYLKLFLSGYALASFHLLRKYGIFDILFPKTAACLNEPEFQHISLSLLEIAFRNTDKRVAEEKTVAPPFLLAAILWRPVRALAIQLKQEQNLSDFAALFQAYEDILQEQRNSFSIPRRFTQIVREIWVLQLRMQRRSGKRAAEIFSHPRFRAAYDFLLLRRESGEEELKPLADWWTEYIEAPTEIRHGMANAVRKLELNRKKRYKPRKIIKS